MFIGKTSNGNNIYLNGNPFDMAEIILPSANFIYNISNDLVAGKSLTIQQATNKNSFEIDWAGRPHLNQSNRRDGQGSISVASGTNTDKLFFQIYNSNQHFNIHYWNYGDSSIQARATDCVFSGMSPLGASNGSDNNSNTDQWQYIAHIVNRNDGKPITNSGKPIDVQEMARQAEAREEYEPRPRSASFPEYNPYHAPESHPAILPNTNPNEPSGHPAGFPKSHHHESKPHFAPFPNDNDKNPKK